MSEYSSQIRRAAIIAARSAVVLSVSIFVLIVFRVVLNGLFDDKWNFDWHLTVRYTAIFGTVWFCGQFIYTFLRLQGAAPSEAILESVPVPNHTRPKLVGFVAMEYYWLILNRTFVVFISPEALYGWKVEGIVTNWDKKYFQPYLEMLNDPDLMHSREAVQKLADLNGGFVIPRSEILTAEIIYGEKWGMGGIPHSGRIRLRLASGATREFILLGSVDAQLIQQEILSGTAAFMPKSFHEKAG